MKSAVVLPPDIHASLPWYAGDRELGLWRGALAQEANVFDAGALGATATELADEVKARGFRVARLPALAGHGRSRAILLAALEAVDLTVEPLASALLPPEARIPADADGVRILPLRPEGGFLAELLAAPAGSVRALGVELAEELPTRSPFPASFAPDDAHWIEGLELALQRHCPQGWSAWRAARLEHRARANGLLRAFAGELLFDINPGLVELIR
ncbi:hypothetical protein [Engelhardtia mirabilis]|uniref:Uncharacterized protein n=1 Tax=Engelhardtia mirabilis TaxID=2528011 RepID=A0A518BFB7_9BACT|nr:hypothetical protein Pla133_07170 [Planctomycetes bacterium Pla133]QDU99977.1 hypothetical protein Pla86_07160 [Planctomycetes bacterium Pla86]